MSAANLINLNDLRFHGIQIMNRLVRFHYIQDDRFCPALVLKTEPFILSVLPPSRVVVADTSRIVVHLNEELWKEQMAHFA